MLENKAFLLKGILDTTFAERPIPELGPDEVLVEVKKTGICGSDVHFYAEGRLGEKHVVTQPFALGHESSVGVNVKETNIGDRVAMEPGSTCRVCPECKGGKYHLCEHMVFPSAAPVDGTLQRYYKFPSEMIYKLPDHLTLEDGAMLEPLSVAVHAVSNIGKLRAGQKVIVFGAGPVGLLCMAAARALGATRIVAVDIVPTRLEFALAYAATDTFLPPPQGTNEKKMEYSKRAVGVMKNALGLEERGPNSIDLVLDATGAETCIQMALLVVKIGGTFVQVGFGALEVQIPITTLIVKELTAKGSITYCAGDYPLALGLVTSGKIDLKPLVTHRFRFEDAVKAFETTRAGKSVDENGQTRNVIKTIISGPDVEIEDV
ncbi:hypothetical protein ACEPAG_5734 [Sanghuangporus baumii]